MDGKVKYEQFDDHLNSSSAPIVQEQVVLHLISQNDVDSLKELGIKTKNMNFLEVFPDADIDVRITPLICACYYGRNDIVKMLLENESIDIDMGSEEAGHTPLTISCMTGNYEILRILTSSGAEVNKPTAFNHTPFVCCFQRLEEEQNVFENRKICLKMAELLLQFGADINWMVDKVKGYTLLQQLCAIKMQLTPKERDTNYEIIKFLIENGANKEILSNKGKKALQLAEKHSNKQEIVELLQNGKQLYFYGPSRAPISEQKQEAKEMTKGQQSKMKQLATYLNFCSK